MVVLSCLNRHSGSSECEMTTCRYHSMKVSHFLHSDSDPSSCSSSSSSLSSPSLSSSFSIFCLKLEKTDCRTIESSYIYSQEGSGSKKVWFFQTSFEILEETRCLISPVILPG